MKYDCQKKKKKSNGFTAQNPKLNWLIGWMLETKYFFVILRLLGYYYEFDSDVCVCVCVMLIVSTLDSFHRSSNLLYSGSSLVLWHWIELDIISDYPRIHIELSGELSYHVCDFGGMQAIILNPTV